MATGLHHPVRAGLLLPVLAAAALLPVLLTWLDEPFYLVLASRIMIYALAAISLNLLVGFGGLVSFGHAAYFGTGAYVVGIAAAHGLGSAWLSWPLAMAIAAAVTMFVAPGPTDDVATMICCRRMRLAKAAAASPMPCSLWPRQTGISSRCCSRECPRLSTLPWPKIPMTPGNSGCSTPSISMRWAMR